MIVPRASNLYAFAEGCWAEPAKGEKAGKGSNVVAKRIIKGVLIGCYRVVRARPCHIGLLHILPPLDAGCSGGGGGEGKSDRISEQHLLVNWQRLAASRRRQISCQPGGNTGVRSSQATRARTHPSRSCQANTQDAQRRAGESGTLFFTTRDELLELKCLASSGETCELQNDKRFAAY